VTPKDMPHTCSVQRCPSGLLDLADLSKFLKKKNRKKKSKNELEHDSEKRLSSWAQGIPHGL